MLRVPLHQLDPDLAVPAYARTGDAGADLLARHDVVVPARGDRIAQLVIMAVDEASFAKVTHEGLGGASRGSGGFGHTGT